MTTVPPLWCKNLWSLKNTDKKDSLSNGLGWRGILALVPFGADFLVSTGSLVENWHHVGRQTDHEPQYFT